MRHYNEYIPMIPDRRNWTLPHVLRMRAKSHGERVFLDVPGSGDRYTYAEALDVATRIGSGLLARGLRPGDRLAIMSANCTEYVLAWLGATMASVVEVPINTAYRDAFFEHQVSTAEPAAFVISAELSERLVESPKACASVRSVFVIGGPESSTAEIEATVTRLSEAGYQAEPFTTLLSFEPVKLPDPEAHELAAVFFTSGTTGLSKGVMMPQAQLYFFADQGRALTRLTEDDVYLSVGPLFHGNAQFLAAYPAMIAGCRFVLREKFSASCWLTWMRESAATVTNFVGVMSEYVWRQPETEADADNSLRCIYAVPTPTAFAERFRARFGVEAFVENYGQTEISMPVLSPYGQPRPPGAAGLGVTDWFDIRLVDPETDEEVPVGHLGELVVRAKLPWTTSQGYYGMPDATAKALRNCWFHTGDMLRRDEDGWYYFVDRSKDTIRRRGENISSYEVEQAITRLAAIAECAVVAVPADEEAGEDEAMAFLVPSGGELHPAEVWEFCDGVLPSFAVPRYLRVVDELPKTPSAKVRKTELRAQGVDVETYDRAAS